jgi:hypothetical protein
MFISEIFHLTFPGHGCPLATETTEGKTSFKEELVYEKKFIPFHG